MPTYGVQQIGLYVPQTEDDIIVKGYVYEDIRRYDINIPPDVYFQLLQQLRDQIDNSQYGLKTQFIEVEGNWVRVQFKQVGSPAITIGIALEIIGIAIAIAFAGYTLSMLAHEVYKIISLLGSENLQWIFTILTLFLVLMMMNPLLSAMSEAFRRKS